MNYFERCLSRMAPTIESMDPGQRQTLAAMLEFQRCRDAQGDGLLCPDDVGLIKATNATAQATFAIAGLTTASVTLPALGLLYCLSFGLEESNLVATSSYTFTVQRSGSTVLTLGRANFQGSTANPRAAACYPVCAGKIQPITLTVTGAAAFPAGATLSIQLYRDFTGDCVGDGGSAYGAKAPGCTTGTC